MSLSLHFGLAVSTDAIDLTLHRSRDSISLSDRDTLRPHLDTGDDPRLPRLAVSMSRRAADRESVPCADPLKLPVSRERSGSGFVCFTSFLKIAATRWDRLNARSALLLRFDRRRSQAPWACISADIACIKAALSALEVCSIPNCAVVFSIFRDCGEVRSRPEEAQVGAIALMMIALWRLLSYLLSQKF